MRVKKEERVHSQMVASTAPSTTKQTLFGGRGHSIAAPKLSPFFSNLSVKMHLRSSCKTKG